MPKNLKSRSPGWWPDPSVLPAQWTKPPARCANGSHSSWSLQILIFSLLIIPSLEFPSCSNATMGDQAWDRSHLSFSSHGLLPQTTHTPYGLHLQCLSPSSVNRRHPADPPTPAQPCYPTCVPPALTILNRIRRLLSLQLCSRPCQRLSMALHPACTESLPTRTFYNSGHLMLWPFSWSTVSPTSHASRCYSLTKPDYSFPSSRPCTSDFLGQTFWSSWKAVSSNYLFLCFGSNHSSETGSKGDLFQKKYFLIMHVETCFTPFNKVRSSK